MCVCESVCVPSHCSGKDEDDGVYTIVIHILPSLPYSCCNGQDASLMCSQFPIHSNMDFMIPAGPVLPMKFRSVKSAASAENEKKMAAHAGRFLDRSDWIWYLLVIKHGNETSPR